MSVPGGSSGRDAARGSSGPSSSSNTGGGAGGAGTSANGSAYERWKTSTRTGRLASLAWTYKRGMLFGLSAGYLLLRYQLEKMHARKRDAIHPNTYLYWKIYDGGIVEAKSAGSNLTQLLQSSSGSPDEPAHVMTLFEVVSTLNMIKEDDRIAGIIADFSSLTTPAVPHYSLGIAQLEEIMAALWEVRRAKEAKLGGAGAKAAGETAALALPAQSPWRTIAFADTFDSQAKYLFASAFDEVYIQPSGYVPLVGLSSTTPFWHRLLSWIGIKMHVEARKDYKSVVAPFAGEKFTDKQKENQQELIDDINHNMMKYIAGNRGIAGGVEALKETVRDGPFLASEAVQKGLVTGTAYKQDVLASIFDDANGGDPERKLKGMYHYSKTMERLVDASHEIPKMDVGVVYLQGAIEAGPAEFGAASVIRGLKEAGEDDDIGAVVLRIDSGGGGVVESDSVWRAVRELQNKHGKIVLASFGNAAASGAYLASTHADAIFAAPSTITGSIGVAMARPELTPAFFEHIKVTLDSVDTGNRSTDITHAPSEREVARTAAHVDEMYDAFKAMVSEGREIHPEVVELLAGGRVMTGLKAFSLVAPEELMKTLETEWPLTNADLTALDEALAPSQQQSAQGSDEGKKAPLSAAVDEALGPMGRGLIDGIGGIREAAICAAEMYLSAAAADYQDEHPDATPVEVMRGVFPDLQVVQDESGKMALNMDVRLRQFPMEKSFSQRLREAVRRGDSIDGEQLSLGHHLRSLAAVFLFRLSASLLASDIDLGSASEIQRLLSLGGASRRSGGMRAEYPLGRLQ